VLLFLHLPVIAQLSRDQLPPEKAGQISDAQLELVNWLTFYYMDPVPDDFPDWLERASAEGMLKDEKRQFPFLGFGATIFAENPDRIPIWMKAIDALPERDRKTVLIALWLSDTRASRAALAERSRKKLLREKNYFNFQSRRRPPHLDELSMDYGGFLDIQWGRFLASGTEMPIKNITSALNYGRFVGSRDSLPRPKTDEEKKAVSKEAIFRSAFWSLKSNCRIHLKVLEICEKLHAEGKLNRFAHLSVKLILDELKPEKYKTEENPSKANASDAESRAAD